MLTIAYIEAYLYSTRRYPVCNVGWMKVKLLANQGFFFIAFEYAPLNWKYIMAEKRCKISRSFFLFWGINQPI